MLPIKIGSLSLVILQNLSIFEAPLNYEKKIGYKTKKIISVQVKSLNGGFFSFRWIAD